MRNHKLLGAVTALLALAAASWALWPDGATPEPLGLRQPHHIEPATVVAAAEDGETGSTSGGADTPARTRAEPLSSTEHESAPRWLLEGVVTNPDGSTAKGAVVRITAVTFDFARPHEHATTTDDAGRYRIDLDEWRRQPEMNRQRVVLFLNAYLPKLAGDSFARLPDDADSQRSLTIPGDISLTGFATITGRVLDVTGQPVANAEVTLMTGTRPSDILTVADRTDEDGRYYVAVGMDGRHTLQAQRRDLGIASALLQIEHHEHMVAADLVLQPASELTGQVVYADGQPVANAKMALGNHDELETDVAGRFVLRHLKPGEYRIHPIGQPDDGGTVTTGAGFQTVTIRSARLKLSFRGARGEKLNRQDVVAHEFPERFGSDLQNATSLQTLPLAARQTAKPRYEYGNDLFAARGTWFWVETPLRAARSCLCVVQLSHHANETIAELVFAEPNLSAQVHVIAHRDDGKLITDLFVSLEPLVRGPRIPYVEVAVAEGKKLRAPPGTHRLRAWQGWSRRYPSTFAYEGTVQLSAGQDLTKAVELRRGGFVEIEVQCHGTPPKTQRNAVATARIDGKDIPLAPYRVLTDNGQLESDQSHLCVGQLAKSKVLLPTGTHVVHLRMGDDVWSQTVEVTIDAHSHVRFDIDR